MTQNPVYTADETEKIKAPQTTNYTIKKGDTLDIIAGKHNIKINTLLKLNHMKLDDPLYFGRTLKVPAQEKEISDENKERKLKHHLQLKNLHLRAFVSEQSLHGEER